MADEFVNTPWAKELVHRVEEAVTAWNARYPTARQPMRVVWGYANRAEAEDEAKEQPDDQFQNALVSYLGWDFELMASRVGDPDLPNYCSVTASIESAELPRQPQRLYNVLRSCQNGVALQTMPDHTEPDASSREIIVVSVRTDIPVEAITSRTFHDALVRLSLSRGLVAKALKDNGGEGDDYWAIDGGDL